MPPVANLGLLFYAANIEPINPRPTYNPYIAPGIPPEVAPLAVVP